MYKAEELAEAIRRLPVCTGQQQLNIAVPRLRVSDQDMAVRAFQFAAVKFTRGTTEWWEWVLVP